MSLIKRSLPETVDVTDGRTIEEAKFMPSKGHKRPKMTQDNWELIRQLRTMGLSAGKVHEVTGRTHATQKLIMDSNSFEEYQEMASVESRKNSALYKPGGKYYKGPSTKLEAVNFDPFTEQDLMPQLDPAAKDPLERIADALERLADAWEAQPTPKRGIFG